MFCRSISWLICCFVAVVVAADHTGRDSTEGSGAEVTVSPLRNDNRDSSTMKQDQKAEETAAEGQPGLLHAGPDAAVTLVAGGTRLAAHTAVLAARSPVFADTFRRFSLQATGGRVAVSGVQGPVLRQLLAYVYTVPGTAQQLLAAADKFGLPGLRAQCEQQVAAELSVETAAATAVLAISNSYVILRQATVDFIKAHAAQVMATRGWSDAWRSHPNVMDELTSLLPKPAVETRSLTAEEKGGRLIEAAKEGAMEELRALLAAGADVRARDMFFGNMTALHKAAWRGQVEAARCLLGAAADIDARHRDQNTPLHLAAWHGQPAMVRLLVESHAHPDARKSNWWTPLHYAAMNGQTEAAVALLEAGADREATDQNGRTPLDFSRENKHQQLIALLTQR
ncbi:ankyrin repeat and protein kinase domain-containing protein 1-like [Schistocerca gregaria]|uniref:ankyrin repeat and protein kinase domain-containing protein 1-like n=1 Tax=Schistocerca gregaria TaxID=7010 RepID=UPI00211E9501|nr:ankyrin repeat and protein kinase domain-containing protein 1-like [Schistocerca gregaria]